MGGAVRTLGRNVPLINPLATGRVVSPTRCAALEVRSTGGVWGHSSQARSGARGARGSSAHLRRCFGSPDRSERGPRGEAEKRPEKDARESDEQSQAEQLDEAATATDHLVEPLGGAARDVSRARRFYEEKIGLRPAQEIVLTPPAAGWPDSFRVRFEYAGVVYDSLREPETPYARGFPSSEGLIDTAGVYLAGSSLWVPGCCPTSARFAITKPGGKPMARPFPLQ